MLFLMQHGKAFSTDKISIIFAAEMRDITDPVAGRFAELKTFVETQREQSPKTFLLYGGGSVGPSALSTLDRGAHIIDILNSVEPDAMGVAKREFTYSQDNLSLRAYEAMFPFVASNITDTRINKTPDGLLQYELISKDNFTVGFISILHETLIEEYLVTNIKLENPKQSVLNKANQLRNAGADLVVLHYFYPFEFIPELLRNGDIDLAFNSSTRIEQNIRDELSKYKRIISLDAPDKVAIANFTLNNNPVLAQFTGTDHYALSEFVADQDVQILVNDYKDRVNRLLDDQVGVWGSRISTRREDIASAENEFANFVVDTIRTYTNADIALVNGGSIRGDSVHAQGSKITRRTLVTEMPYRSTLRLLKVSGQNIKEALEYGLSGIDSLKGRFLHLSGVTLIFDSSRAIGSRLIDVKVAGKKLDLEHIYTVATTHYLSRGGDGFSMLKDSQIVANSEMENLLLISDLVLRSVRIQGGINSKKDQRITNRARGKE